MLACPKAEVILVLLDKREIFRATLLKRLRGVAEPYRWPTSARSAWVYEEVGPIDDIDH